MNLGISIIEESNSNLIISGIIPRRNDFDNKITKINNILKGKCNERNVGFLSHNNIKSKYHRNGSGLHLNYDGTSILTENFIHIMDKLDSEY